MRREVASPLLNVQKLLIGLFLLVFALPLFGEHKSPDLLTLSHQTTSILAAPYTEYLEDKSHALTLTDILKHPRQAFTPTTTDMLTFGRSESAWWIHFNLVNQTQANWYFLLDANLGDELELFIFPAGLSAKSINTALVNNYATRVKDYPRYLWQLDIPQNQLFDVYIRATNGGSIFNLPIRILQANDLVKHTFYSYRLVSFVFAGMIVLAAYQFLTFLVLRESSYIILAIYMFSMMLTLHRNTPVFEPLYFLSKTDAHFFTAPFFIVIASSSALAREILNTSHYAPKLDWGFKAIIVVALISMLMVGFFPSGSNYPPLLGLALLPFTFFTSVYVASKGYRPALYFTLIYLINLGIYLPLLVVLIWDTEVWQPLQDVVFSLGALVFMLFLSIIQAERMRNLRDQVSRAELSNKTKDEFLAVMSHELRTPMNAVVGLGTLLKLTPLSNVQKVYVDKLEIATQHMMQLISNVLDFAKFRSANFKPLQEPFKLIMVLNSVASVIEQQTEEKNLDFKLNINGSVEDGLLGDRLRLTQVLFNLLDNAIKYTDQGSITLKITTKSKAPSKLSVLIKVIDTGRGIDRLSLTKLFEPFVQVSPSLQKREGVGLGLAISKRLVEMMGGTLTVESAPDKGSRFIVDLCFDLADYQVNETQSLLTPVGRKLRLPHNLKVLLLDSSELNRLIGGAMLRELGAAIYFAENSSKAKSILNQQAVDLLLVDLEGDDACNWKLVSELRQQTSLASLPVIGMLSKQTQDSLLDQAVVDVYLSKPFDYEALYAALNRALVLKQQRAALG